MSLRHSSNSDRGTSGHHDDGRGRHDDGRDHDGRDRDDGHDRHDRGDCHRDDRHVRRGDHRDDRLHDDRRRDGPHHDRHGRRDRDRQMPRAETAQQLLLHKRDRVFAFFVSPQDGCGCYQISPARLQQCRN